MPTSSPGALPGNRTPEEAPTTIGVRALFLGERIDTRGLEKTVPLATSPLTVPVPGGRTAVIFRYGAVVVFAAHREATERFLESLAPFVTEAFVMPEEEQTQLVIGRDADEHVDTAGNLIISAWTTERLQLVADALAKSLVLAHYEAGIATVFDRLEPLATTLKGKGRVGASSKELLHHIGNVLSMQHKWSGASKPVRNRSCYGSIQN
jgi:uncharacterized Rmd1/YagE family protein